MRSAPVHALVAIALGLGLTVTGCGALSPQTPPPVADSPIPLSGATESRTSHPAASSPPTPACTVTPSLASLTVRQKAAQILTVGVSSLDDARRAVDDHGVGGIFIGSDATTQMLSGPGLHELTATAAHPPLVSIDEEGGRVSRLRPLAGPMPSARRMAQTMTPDQVRAMAAERGKRLRDLGVTVDFAPSIDVSDQPDDSVIGDRSFSDDPEKVTTYGRAFAQGLLDSGVTPVFKHFPGHGHSSGDSHEGPVTVPPITELEKRDLLPFARLSSMPGAAVMVGHLDVPGLTEAGRPTSLSPATYRLLRDGGHGLPPFPGPIFTDDLSGMRAITNSFSVPDAVLESLRAGADSPLWISTVELPAVLDRIERAVADGSYSLARLDASLTRMLQHRGSTDCPR